ncbi:phosphatidate cytidylyltransferase [Helicobacter mustelae]|uniref:Phosphatidate cytidylyltransferase n=1 Tax=Helicobacter mustelae (strain ATCC 43772 / CCUG 25715 / CIP 103759 / LMG 18044 / NCTC 12198 / R85-136P) TaxID=679897 RepID=D3UHS7_HELM1|nr:phosphatidate cytidylyltransferase [Helicobacter mustelae]CBG40050.1 phosphatidate cytidylyltransferase [Helicobacter mustelae 12198]SQH71564.1 phosphatidate cytidylyltransferase [Helicobacter mustelae]
MNLKNAFLNEKKRYVTGIILLVIFVILVWINNVYLIWATLGLTLLAALKESLVLLGCKQSFLLFVFTSLVWISAFFNQNPMESAIFGAMLLSGILAYRQSFSPRYILAFLYPTLPFLTLFSIYKDFGIEAIVWLVIIIALCDSAAYFGGRIFGKTPLSPSSPKKTIEGLLIGTFFSVVIGSLLGIGILHQGFLVSFFISLVVALSGVLGDLFESYLKRRENLKDSGSFLPGHGGILDRFDAILFGAIAMHFLLYFSPTYETSFF